MQTQAWRPGEKDFGKDGTISKNRSFWYVIAHGKFCKAITAKASDTGNELKAEGVSNLCSIIKMLKDFTSRETFP